jgi:hypothetical protein
MLFDCVIIKNGKLVFAAPPSSRIQLIALLGWQPYLGESLKEAWQ